MFNLLRAECYKLFHSRCFWGIAAFALCLSSVLLADSVGQTSSLFFASLYNVPVLYFLAIIFCALFIGDDFACRTLSAYVSAGHSRSQILFAKLVVCQLACMAILVLPLLAHGWAGRLFLKEAFAGGPGTVAVVAASLLAMCLLPFFFAFWFRDTGKAMAVPMMLFFLMIFWMNGDKARLVSQILPMGQLRLTALQQDALPAARFVLTDCIWIFLLSMGAYGGFRRADLK